MSRPRIVVVGSSNTDMVVRTERLPAPGETVSGGRFLISTAYMGPEPPKPHSTKSRGS